MGKIYFKMSLKSDDENMYIESSGIKSKNKIIYKENNINVTILIFDNKIEMNRSCDDYKINLIFELKKHTQSTYNVFDFSKTYKLDTYTEKLIIKNNIIEIDYVIEENRVEYKLEMEDL